MVDNFSLEQYQVEVIEFSTRQERFAEQLTGSVITKTKKSPPQTVQTVFGEGVLFVSNGCIVILQPIKSAVSYDTASGTDNPVRRSG